MTDEEFISLTDKYKLRKIIAQFAITPDQAVKFVVFNDRYAWGADDAYIGFENIVAHQPHITLQDLVEAQRRLDAVKPR